MIKKFCHEESVKENQGCESKKKKKNPLESLRKKHQMKNNGSRERERVALQELPIDRNDQGNKGNEVKAGKLANSLHSLTLSYIIGH